MSACGFYYREKHNAPMLGYGKMQYVSDVDSVWLEERWQNGQKKRMGTEYWRKEGREIKVYKDKNEGSVPTWKGREGGGWKSNTRETEERNKDRKGWTEKEIILYAIFDASCSSSNVTHEFQGSSLKWKCLCEMESAICARLYIEYKGLVNTLQFV